MKALSHLIEGVAIKEILGGTTVLINSLQFDSRDVGLQDCYIAQKGTQVDGHDFIEQAIKQGANTIVCVEVPKIKDPKVTYVVVDSSSETLGIMASNFYDTPSHKLNLIGVTGTNGKTTTVTILYSLFRKLGKKTGLISTVVNKINDQEVKSTHTTPNSVALNQLLARMVSAGCEYCFMEVSSHAVVQNRIAGLYFRGGVFTNITHEHLDFHKTFKAYIEAKQLFFTGLSKHAFALSNKDDKNGEVMLQNSKAEKNYYGLKSAANIKCRVLESSFEGLSLKVDGVDFWSPLIGKFNAYNLTAVYGVAKLLGEDKTDILRELSTLSSVDGRFQYTYKNNIHGIVDYAHTPDALENVLKTIKDIGPKGKVITVVGCGGDRDRTKRPKMAAIAAQFSNQIVITSDNPRTEDPQLIINEMLEGLNAGQRAKTLSMVNRKEAIRTACALAQKEDVILIAGKGHETYQEINGVRNHFDDSEELNEALNAKSKLN